METGNSTEKPLLDTETSYTTMLRIKAEQAKLLKKLDEFVNNPEFIDKLEDLQDEIKRADKGLSARAVGIEIFQKVDWGEDVSDALETRGNFVQNLNEIRASIKAGLRVESIISERRYHEEQREKWEKYD